MEKLIERPLDILEPEVEYSQVITHEDMFDQFEIEREANWLIDQRNSRETPPVHHQERRDNARTALMEALTASGHCSIIEIHGNTAEEVNQQVMSRLLNGWDESLPQHEKQRRFYEICEEIIIQKVQRRVAEGVLPPDTEIGIISDVPEHMNPHQATNLGYRLKNKKGMVRSTSFRREPDGTFTRVIEQISRSNSGPATTRQFFSYLGTPLDSEMPHDLAALKKPFIYSRHDFIDGVVDVQRRLDSFAGSNVRYGEQLGAGKETVTYESLRQESARREREIENYIDDLARLEAQLDNLLANGKISENERLNIFKEEIDRILTAICTVHPDYAEDTYGKEAAKTFYEASRMVASGDSRGAALLLEANSHMKETVTFCGVAISVKEAQEQGLEVTSFGEAVEKGKKDWEWKQGICQVESCTTRPGKTKVGPCSVCEKCQAKFDAGVDPTKPSILSVLFSSTKKAKPA